MKLELSYLDFPGLVRSIASFESLDIEVEYRLSEDEHNFAEAIAGGRVSLSITAAVAMAIYCPEINGQYLWYVAAHEVGHFTMGHVHMRRYFSVFRRFLNFLKRLFQIIEREADRAAKKYAGHDPSWTIFF